MDVDITTIPIITACVSVLIAIIRTAFFRNNENFSRLIPLLSLIFGIAAALIAFYFVPGTFSTNNVVVACLTGAASGLAATGSHQIFKQWAKGTEEEAIQEEEKEDGENKKK